MEPIQFSLIALPVLTLLLFALERAVPLREPKRLLVRRLIVNGCVGALAVAAAFVFVRPVVVRLIERADDFGLLSILAVPDAVKWIIGFLLLDLSFYYWHRANHASRILWRLHNVHHTDPDLDVSTAFRFHFAEIALSAGFRVVQIVLIGGPVSLFVVYELVFQVQVLFQHSNVRLPFAAERWLSWVLVTPRMHGIHHSHVREENNSNLSTVFSCWDRCHRTLRLNVPQSQVDIGIPGYSLPEDNQVARVLLMPFRRQRDYWQTKDGVVPTRSPMPEASQARLTM